MTQRLVLPLRLVWDGDVPIVMFGAVASDRLRAPFWHDAIADPLEIVALKPLDAFAYNDSELKVAGGIYHMTRCGSTLLMRQFGRLPRVMPLSEPEIFAQLLDGPPAPAALTARRLRQLLAAHRDALSPVADRLVLKWLGLCAHHANVIAAAVPEVPTVYLHRDPVEVLASIERNALGGTDAVRPRHLGAGFGAVPDDPIEVAALLIAYGCRALAHVPGLRSLDYATLPDATVDRVAPFFRFALSDADRAAMQAAAQTHSKDPADAEVFAPDAAEKRRRATPHAVALAHRIVQPALDIVLATTTPL